MECSKLTAVSAKGPNSECCFQQDNQMDKPRILIVDDDDEVRTQMRWALTSKYDVLMAEDRGTALDVLKRDKPGGVRLDLGLPPSPRASRAGFLGAAPI